MPSLVEAAAARCKKNKIIKPKTKNKNTGLHNISGTVWFPLDSLQIYDKSSW